MAYNNNKTAYPPKQQTSTSVAEILNNPIVLPKILENKMSVDDFKVVKATCFPAAKDNNIVALAIEYCRVRNLDVMKKMVHIVSFNGKDNILPSIAEARVTATRTGTYVGKGSPVYGPSITTEFKGGYYADAGKWVDTAKTITYPEWCEVTVYRFVQGKPRAFTERVEWMECVQMNGTVPNSMWSKRVKGQLAKCAEAASLRAAFPEELGGLITAEEIEGNDEILTQVDISPTKSSDPVKDALNQMKIEDAELEEPLIDTVAIDTTEALLPPPALIIGEETVEVLNADMGVEYLSKFIKAASLKKIKQDLIAANQNFIGWLFQNGFTDKVDALHALSEEGK